MSFEVLHFHIPFSVVYRFVKSRFAMPRCSNRVSRTNARLPFEWKERYQLFFMQGNSVVSQVPLSLFLFGCYDRRHGRCSNWKKAFFSYPLGKKSRCWYTWLWLFFCDIDTLWDRRTFTRIFLKNHRRHGWYVEETARWKNTHART